MWLGGNSIGHNGLKFSIVMMQFPNLLSLSLPLVLIKFSPYRIFFTAYLILKDLLGMEMIIPGICGTVEMWFR
uniref:Uncharacterized protein n=1 Tax=Anguilla anguilla TaxID=7936 RepID=A0A0E9X2M8_ANGAN